MVEWQEGLEQKGLYYEGIIDGTRLDSVLELHRRSTVSTFGTRRSSRVSATQTDKPTNSENVRDLNNTNNKQTCNTHSKIYNSKKNTRHVQNKSRPVPTVR